MPRTFYRLGRFMHVVSALSTMGLVLLFGLVAVARGAAPMCVDQAALSRTRGPARGPSSVNAIENGVTVIQLDSELPVESFRAQGYDVKTRDDYFARDPWQDPDPRLRDRLFGHAGLKSYVAGWDQLRRDMLFLRAQEQTIVRLMHKYPQIPKTRLQALVDAINVEKGAR